MNKGAACRAPLGLMRNELRASAATALVIVMGWALPAKADDTETGGGIDDIIVTAQRQAETAQDVPIAITAFSGDDMARRQIEGFSDLQFSTPGLSFSAGNFQGANIAIRGIGQTAIGGSGEGGVGVHINDMPLILTRLQESEYFDMERIEVLRGPQGTLFGRNATGGVVNLLTARPVLENASSASIEYGNYDSLTLRGMVNLPLGDKAALRLAGLYLKRDGYTTNLHTGNDIDGRDQYALRASVRLEPGDNTRIDLMGQYFRENSNRSRMQKQMCHRDPTGILGCQPDALAYETVNMNATLSGLLTSPYLFGGTPLAGLALTSGGEDAAFGVVNPADMRTVNIDYEPRHYSEEVVAMLNATHSLDTLELSVVAGYQRSTNRSNTDYYFTVENPVAVPASFAALFPTAYNAFYTQGWPVSQITPDRYLGVANGAVAYTGGSTDSYDQSYGREEQYSIELKARTQFDGWFNATLGVSYFDATGRADYYIASAQLDYASFILPTLGVLSAGASHPYYAAVVNALTNGQPSPLDGLAAAPAYYNSEGYRYTLKSLAVFGEAYAEITPDLKLTAGLRGLRDRKSVTDRAILFNGTTVIGSDTIDGLPAHRTDRTTFRRLTGRLVLDWKPSLPFTDDTLVYVSYARGFKSGGFNPPFDPVQYPDASLTYQPEAINAFEIGTKNVLADGRLRLNLSGFYYDYKGLQVGVTRNRTTINENIDAEIYGLEADVQARPHPHWRLSLGGSLMNSRIRNGSSVDTRDPSAGRDDVVIIKDIASSANCAVIPAATGIPRADLLAPALFAATGGTVAVPGTNTVGAFSSCAALAGAIDTLGLPYQVLRDANGNPVGLPSGVEVDLAGNELQLTPNWMVTLGVEYARPVFTDLRLTLRVDYSARGGFYGRMYNRPIDRISGYDIWNAQAQLDGPGDRWFVRLFVQNIENEDNVTGIYVTDPATGLFTNVFTTEPRRYGLAAGINF